MSSTPQRGETERKSRRRQGREERKALLKGNKKKGTTSASVSLGQKTCPGGTKPVEEKKDFTGGKNDQGFPK